MALKALANEKCLQITTWNGGESDRKSNRSKIRLRTTLWLLKRQEQHLFQNQSPHWKHSVRASIENIYDELCQYGKSVQEKVISPKNGIIRESFKHCFAEIILANFFAELGGKPPLDAINR